MKYILICLKEDEEKILENLKKYDFLKVVEVQHHKLTRNDWSHVIIDSKEFLEWDFGRKINSEVGDCLAVFDKFDERKCRICGCTNWYACKGGCSWIENDLCSQCYERERQQEDTSYDTCNTGLLNKRSNENGNRFN